MIKLLKRRISDSLRRLMANLRHSLYFSIGRPNNPVNQSKSDQKMDWIKMPWSTDLNDLKAKIKGQRKEGKEK